MNERFRPPVLIIDAGAAGLAAALRLAEHTRVTVLSKGPIEGGSTWKTTKPDHGLSTS